MLAEENREENRVRSLILQIEPKRFDSRQGRILKLPTGSSSGDRLQTRTGKGYGRQLFFYKLFKIATVDVALAEISG